MTIINCSLYFEITLAKTVFCNKIKAHIYSIQSFMHGQLIFCHFVWNVEVCTELFFFLIPTLPLSKELTNCTHPCSYFHYPVKLKKKKKKRKEIFAMWHSELYLNQFCAKECNQCRELHVTPILISYFREVHGSWQQFIQAHYQPG